MSGLPAVVTILDLATGTLSSSAVFPASQTTNAVATTIGVSLVQIASAIFSAAIVPVPSGGTNTSSLTANGILYGNGSSTVGITAAGGTSLPLLGQGANNTPAFGVVPLAGGGINTTTLTQNGVLFGNGTATVGISAAGNTALVLLSPGPLANPTFGQVNLTAAVTGVLGVPNGGHGTSTLTQNGLVYGNGSSTVGITAAGGTSLPLLGQGANNAPVFGVVPLAGGGINTTTLTAFGVVFGNGASTVGITAAGATGQMLMGQGNAAPVMQYPGNTLLNTLTASNVSALQDTTSFTTTFNDYLLLIDNIVPTTTSAVLQCQVMVSAAFQTASYLNAAGGATTFVDFTAATLVATSNIGVSGFVYFQNANNTAVNKWLRGSVALFSTAPGQTNVAGYWNGGQQAIAGLKFMPSTGNFSGTIRIYGVRAS